MRHRAATLVAVVLAACIRVPVEVEVQTEKSIVTRLAAVETWVLTPPGSPNPVLGPRVEAGIRDALADRSMRETAIENAEIAVRYRTADPARLEGLDEAHPHTIEIEVSDAQTNELLWRGTGRVGAVSNAELPAAVGDATRTVLEEFPRPE